MFSSDAKLFVKRRLQFHFSHAENVSSKLPKWTLFHLHLHIFNYSSTRYTSRRICFVSCLYISTYLKMFLVRFIIIPPAVLSSGALCLQRLKIQIEVWVWVWSRCNKLFQKFQFVFLVHLKVVTVIWYTASEAVNNLCKVVYFLTRFINLLTCYFQLVDDNNRWQLWRMHCRFPLWSS